MMHGTLHKEKVVEVPFEVTGKLVLAREYVEDIERGYFGLLPERLFLIKEGKRKRVLTLSDLGGDVRLRSEVEALAYVRLRTSPATFHAFGPYYGPDWSEIGSILTLEVLPRSHVSNSMFFGLALHSRDRFKGSAIEGDRGVISDELADSLGIFAPSVQATAGGFLVKRVVVEATGLADPPWNLEPFVVKRIEEEVTENGKYVLRAANVIEDVRLDRIRWVFFPLED